MTRRSRGARIAMSAALVVAGVGAVTGCTKPTPRITVLGGRTTVTVTASTYCFTSSRCPSSHTVDLPAVTVPADDKVLIDVPRAVEARGWQTTALSLDGTKALGTSGAIHGRYSYRVPSGVAQGDTFIVQVNELSHGKPDGSTWSFLVKVSLTAS